MKVTGEGKRFMIAVFLISVAAVNTGNNLIYLVLSLMLSFLFLSFLLLKLNLFGLSLKVGCKPAVFAGEEASVELLIKNDKRLITTYSVSCIVPGALAPVYYGMIEPLKAVEREARVKFVRRGLYRFGDFWIRSGFPFILLYEVRSMKASGDVLVYPALRDVGDMFHKLAASDGLEALSLSLSGDDVHSLRQYRYGDDWRRIHWKVSAKTGELFVKEYAEHESIKVTITLDNLLPEGGETFEKAVSLAGSLARYFLEKGSFVRILSCKKVIPFGKGGEHLLKILDILAVIKEEEAWESPLQYEGTGFSLLVMKSRRKPGDQAMGMNHMVIYADSV